MARAGRQAVLAILIVAAAGCGYFQSGSWEDDPKNWRRAFGENAPGDVEVVHSLYTRYPHFTHEQTFYFEFKAERPFLDSMISRFSLAQGAVPPEETQTPEWFVPEPRGDYDVWVGVGTLREAVLYVHRGTGVAYFRHFQL